MNGSGIAPSIDESALNHLNAWNDEFLNAWNDEFLKCPRVTAPLEKRSEISHEAAASCTRKIARAERDTISGFIILYEPLKQAVEENLMEDTRR